MKFLQIFNKTPNYKKFSYAPRFYDPKQEEHRERELRIKKELEDEKSAASAESGDPVAYTHDHRERIRGSFRGSKKNTTSRPDTSASMLRLIILLVLTIGLIAFLQFGTVALYGLAMVFVPVYLYSKFRNLTRR